MNKLGYKSVKRAQRLIDVERDAIVQAWSSTGKDKGVRVRGVGICIIPTLPIIPPKL
jgi:hypothetical protein